MPNFVQIGRETKKFSVDCNSPGLAAGYTRPGASAGGELSLTGPLLWSPC